MREERRAGGHDRASGDTQGCPAVHACGAGRASRLEGKREQLLRKREAVQAEVERIDRAVARSTSCSSCSHRCSPATAANRGGRRRQRRG